MLTKSDFIALGEIFGQELSLASKEEFKDHDQLLEAIEMRVGELMERDPALLFSYLYRLDVSERKVRNILNAKEGIKTITELAKLILDRQIKRLYTKKSIKQKPIEGWEW